MTSSNDNTKVSSSNMVQEKLHRPLDEIIKENKKKNLGKKQRPQHFKKNQNKTVKKANKGIANQANTSASIKLNPSKVHVTIKNEYAKPSQAVHGPAKIHRMDIDSAIDYGRPVHKPKKPFRPPPSRQPRIVKP
jgi:hypothetical protein